MRRATRIPLHRQPPVWLISCVVLASLSPVLLRAFGVELGPPLPVDPVAMARADEPVAAQPIVDLAARSPVIARFDRVAVPSALASASPEPEIVIVDEETSDPDAADLDDAGDLAEPLAALAEATGPDAITESTPRGTQPDVARPTEGVARRAELAEAKAACRRGNKDVARSVYRDLPVGDARRKEIRRACRQEGVWIL
jgi:hypothetical protein